MIIHIMINTSLQHQAAYWTEIKLEVLHIQVKNGRVCSYIENKVEAKLQWMTVNIRKYETSVYQYSRESSNNNLHNNNPATLTPLKRHVFRSPGNLILCNQSSYGYIPSSRPLITTVAWSLSFEIIDGKVSVLLYHSHSITAFLRRSGEERRWRESKRHLSETTDL